MISDTCRPMHYTWFVNSFSNANIFCKPSLDYFCQIFIWSKISTKHYCRDVHTCKKTRQFKTWQRLPVQLKVTHTVHKLEYCDFIKIR